MLVSLFSKVSTDGFLSFRDEFSGNKRTPFPIDGAESDVPMIAALWAGFSFTTEGVVYSRVTDDPTMLTEVSEMITEANPDLSGYEPSTAVIVTWFLAQPGKDDSNDSVGVYVSH